MSLGRATEGRRRRAAAAEGRSPATKHSAARKANTATPWNHETMCTGGEGKPRQKAMPLFYLNEMFRKTDLKTRSKYLPTVEVGLGIN